MSRHTVDEAIGGFVDSTPQPSLHSECAKCGSQFTTLVGLAEHINNAHSSLRDYTSAERKAMPVHTGVMLYFPDALAAVARVSKHGNDKHNPGEPLHWARGKSMDQTDCAARHLLTPDATDPDSGEPEFAHATWRMLAELQLKEEKRLVAAGIKPLSGIVP